MNNIIHVATMNDNRKNEITALIITLLLCLVVVLILVNTFLRYQPITSETHLKQDTIMFGGEYVMLGDMTDAIDGTELASDASLDNQQAQQPDVEGDDVKDAGEPTKTPAPLVTDVKESPMKVKEKIKDEPTKKPGPAVDKKTADKKEQVKQVKQPTNSATDSRIKNAFGSSGASGTGKQGSPEGNSGQGALAGKPGLGGLQGYTLEYWGRPHSKWAGTVEVRVRVNARGKVIEAHAVGGKGEAYSHPEVRRSCEEESLKSAFSVPTNRTTEGVGTIKWTFI